MSHINLSTRPQRYLNPALWDAVTLGNKTAESQLQAYMWQTESTCNPTRTFTPDAVTTYDYDYDNRLTTVNLPTNNDTVEYTYDATGRRLTKEYTYHNGANTDVTTYKYHYIGSQITEIEIDSIRNPGATQSVLRNEEVKIHLGANSQPISYEWVKHVGENTTSATYYYHYDIHGNVLKITDSSENTKITYTYDTLGTILTETNPDSILNFFTFRGASQTIWEPETGLYYSGGYYRPDTGTALQGTGAPVLTNPSSSAMLNSIALATSANAQLGAHAAVSASSAGGSGGSFAPPPGPSDGFAHAGNQGPPMNTDSLVQIDDSVFDSSPLLLEGWRPIIVESEDRNKFIQPRPEKEKLPEWDCEGSGEGNHEDFGLGLVVPWDIVQIENNVDGQDQYGYDIVLLLIAASEYFARHPGIPVFNIYVLVDIYNGGLSDAGLPKDFKTEMERIINDIKNKIDVAVWIYSTEAVHGPVRLMVYKLSDQNPVFLTADGKRYDQVDQKTLFDSDPNITTYESAWRLEDKKMGGHWNYVNNIGPCTLGMYDAESRTAYSVFLQFDKAQYKYGCDPMSQSTYIRFYAGNVFVPKDKDGVFIKPPGWDPSTYGDFGVNSFNWVDKYGEITCCLIDGDGNIFNFNLSISDEDQNLHKWLLFFGSGHFNLR